MHAIPDHEHAPHWTIRYTVPVEKLTRQERSHLSPNTHIVSRTAGSYIAWTKAEAIDAARRAGTLPQSARSVTATQHEEADSPLFA